MPEETVRLRAFSRFFTNAATPVDLHDDRLIVLDDLSKVLLVEHGAVDVFAVHLEEHRPHGRWTFLCRVNAGTLLHGSPRGPRHALACRPVPRSYVSTLPLSRLAALSPAYAGSPVSAGGTAAGEAVRALSAPQYALAVQQLVTGLDSGIAALAQALRDNLPPREFVPLAPRGPTDVSMGVTARSIDDVLWVTVDAGIVRMPDGITGRLTAGERMCVTERDWLVAEESARLTAGTTLDLLTNGKLWPQLIAHATRFLYTVDRRIERRDAAEREDLTRRIAAADRVVGNVTRSFDAVARDAEARVRIADVISDPAPLAAVRLVASRMRTPVRPPVTPDGPGRSIDPVQRIALNSGMRTRTVRLEDGWWRRDLGPMVGRRTVDKRPVALLPEAGGYVAALATDNDEVAPVTKESARLLENKADVLYAPLPSGVRSARALLRFGQRGNRRDVRQLAITGLLVAALGLLSPVMTGTILGTFVARAQKHLIIEGAMVVIGAGFVAAALSVVMNIAALRLEGRSTATLQSAVWIRLLSLPVSFFSRFSTGELGTAALGINAVQETLSSVTTTATLGLLTGSANLVLVYFYSVPLALIATGLVVTGAAVCAIAGFFEVRWQRELYTVEQRLSSTVFQLLNGLPKLRVAAAEDRAFGVWAAEFTRSRTLATSARRVQNVITTFNAGFPLLCTVVIFGVVAGPLHGQLPIATFLSFFTAFSLLLAATLQFTGVAITTMNVVPMLERLGPILEAEQESTAQRADPGELSGQITLSHVSFRYGEDGPLALRDVTFSVRPGEFVAIVGPTGCGKSTILRLLLGFETPTSGAVLYDGQDLTELDVTLVRRQCGVVLQNGALLAGSIKDNIIGGASYTLDDAWAAARMAGIDEEIAALPMGMHTGVSEGTSTLSGGQRQRIMIARALVSRPRMVFFDEATSALDNPTQQVIAESTRNLNATRIVIAHRLSTVADADRILVLDGGRIVQEGTYQQLIAESGGLFARLATRQTY
ncbi:MAG TPA: NHLP bacteriocin export ABC transporter permease/ATPase subunit [Streptosporangiaceae bacterium]